MKSLIALTALSCLLAGCSELVFTAVSTPPPSRVGSCNNEKRTVLLSSATALAIECQNFGGEDTGPCKRLSVSSSNPDVAQVYLAYVDYLVEARSSTGYVGPQAAAVFVVVGKRAGTARIQVKADQGGADLNVTVTPP